MAFTDPQRHIQRLLDALTDEGLEDLTHRLVKPEYPEAHRVRGKDGGIDVLSDYGKSPERGWQAKNYKECPLGRVSEVAESGDGRRQTAALHLRFPLCPYQGSRPPGSHPGRRVRTLASGVE